MNYYRYKVLRDVRSPRDLQHGLSLLWQEVYIIRPLRGVMRLSYLHGLTEIILVFLTMALHFRVIHQRTAISLFLLIIFSIATLRTM